MLPGVAKFHRRNLYDSGSQSGSSFPFVLVPLIQTGLGAVSISRNFKYGSPTIFFLPFEDRPLQIGSCKPGDQLGPTLLHLFFPLTPVIQPNAGGTSKHPMATQEGVQEAKKKKNHSKETGLTQSRSASSSAPESPASPDLKLQHHQSWVRDNQQMLVC